MDKPINAVRAIYETERAKIRRAQEEQCRRDEALEKQFLNERKVQALKDYPEVLLKIQEYAKKRYTEYTHVISYSGMDWEKSDKAYIEVLIPLLEDAGFKVQTFEEFDSFYKRSGPYGLKISGWA